MNVAVVGTGYVGLVTGCCLASMGHRVRCIDKDAAKIAALSNGVSPIYEAGLNDLLASGLHDGTISFTTDLKEGVDTADVVFLALPTPPMQDGSADLSAVLSVAKTLGPLLPDRYCVVVNKSTVPVGTSAKVADELRKTGASQFDVVSNPEFLREGVAVSDFFKPERIVIGSPSERAASVMRALYEPLISDNVPLFVTTPPTAELSKYAANTFLTTKINFMNEIAQLCERMNADVDTLRDILGSDSRIGAKFLYPGIGAGGSCFPKDVRALRFMAQELGYDFKLIEATIQVNQQQHYALVDKIVSHFDGSLDGVRLALWGLAFKPNTDDIRESPALYVLDELLARGASVSAFDPQANANVARAYHDTPRLTLVNDPYAALEGADGLVIGTEWSEFKQADLAKIARSLRRPLVFDGRNIYTPDVMRNHNFDYYSIGRRPISAAV